MLIGLAQESIVLKGWFVDILKWAIMEQDIFLVRHGKNQKQYKKDRYAHHF